MIEGNGGCIQEGGAFTAEGAFVIARGVGTVFVAWQREGVLGQVPELQQPHPHPQCKSRQQNTVSFHSFFLPPPQPTKGLHPISTAGLGGRRWGRPQAQAGASCSLCSWEHQGHRVPVTQDPLSDRARPTWGHPRTWWWQHLQEERRRALGDAT